MRRGLQIFTLLLMICLISLLAVQRFVPAVPIAPVILKSERIDSVYAVIGPGNLTSVQPVHHLMGPSSETRLWRMQYTPDGRFLIAGWGDGIIRMWDVQTGTLVRTFQKKDNPLGIDALSPDGRWLITKTLHQNKYDMIDVWDLQTGELLYTLQGYQTIALSPKGQIALKPTDSYQTIEIWSDLGKDRTRLITLEGDPYYEDVFYSPDGRFLYAKTLKLLMWDTRTWEQIFTVDVDYDYGFLLSRDGHLLTTQINDVVKLWDTDTQTLLHTWEPGMSTRGIFMSPDSRHVSAVAEESPYGVDIYDWSTQTLLHSFQGDVPAHYMPDGRLIYSFYSNMLRFWDTTSFEFVGALELDSDSIFEMSPDGLTFATTVDNHTIKIWAVHQPVEVCRIASASDLSSRSLSPETAENIDVVRRFDMFGPSNLAILSPDNQHLAADGTSSRSVNVWDVNDNFSLALYEYPLERLTDDSFSPDSQSLTTFTTEGQRIVRNVSTGEIQSTEDQTVAMPDDNIFYSPDGRFVVTTAILSEQFSSDGRTTYVATLSNAQTGESLVAFESQLARRNENHVKGVFFDPDGAWIAVAYGSVMEIWDVASSQLHGMVTGLAGVYGPIALSHDGKTLAALAMNDTSDKYEMAFWEMPSGTLQYIQSMIEDQVAYNALVFSLDDRLLVVETSTGLAFWDTTTGEKLKNIDLQQRMFSAVLSEDGHYIVTASEGFGPHYMYTTIRVWGLCNP